MALRSDEHIVATTDGAEGQSLRLGPFVIRALVVFGGRSVVHVECRRVIVSDVLLDHARAVEDARLGRGIPNREAARAHHGGIFNARIAIEVAHVLEDLQAADAGVANITCIVKVPTAAVGRVNQTRSRAARDVIIISTRITFVDGHQISTATSRKLGDCVGHGQTFDYIVDAGQFAGTCAISIRGVDGLRDGSEAADFLKFAGSEIEGRDRVVFLKRDERFGVRCSGVFRLDVGHQGGGACVVSGEGVVANASEAHAGGKVGCGKIVGCDIRAAECHDAACEISRGDAREVDHADRARTREGAFGSGRDELTFVGDDKLRSVGREGYRVRMVSDIECFEDGASRAVEDRNAAKIRGCFSVGNHRGNTEAAAIGEHAGNGVDVCGSAEGGCQIDGDARGERPIAAKRVGLDGVGAVAGVGGEDLSVGIRHDFSSVW